MSQREKRHSEEIARRHHKVHSASFTKVEILSQTPIVEQKNFFYKPTPPPETVVVHSKPKKSKDACCWGW
ncbi:hypothetical protein BDF21DRAFT_424556 [Thamnidium elegans]|nr:hypothetical protein BDF21DRAFT_424556 [Thamnidium elegans]